MARKGPMLETWMRLASVGIGGLSLNWMEGHDGGEGLDCSRWSYSRAGIRFARCTVRICPVRTPCSTFLAPQ